MVNENEVLKEVLSVLTKQTEKGLKKYGNTVNPDQYTATEWIDHLQEELIDSLVYSTIIKQKIKELTGENNMMNELTSKIRKWAIERGLNDADPTKQMLKLFEEIGEIASGMARGDMDEIKDGIGDTVVVLTILAMQLGTSIDECTKIAYDEIKHRKGRLVNGVYVKESDL